MRPLLQYTDRYQADIGRHVFPMDKYGRVIESLVSSGVITAEDVVEPQPASVDDALLVHTKAYVHDILTGGLSEDDIIRLELPFSRSLVDSFFLAAGGTIAALRSALERGVGVNVGGGFHHAYPDHAEGFCLLNDVAIGVARLLADRTVSRVAVVDCDVHQGNGTAATFSHDPRVFTFSIHQENNYPFPKPPSSLDIPLADWTEGPTYLERLAEGLPWAIDDFDPELVLYVAGADPYEHDFLGGLKLSPHDLAERDAMVMGACAKRGVPFAAVLAGGYAARTDETVAIHAATVTAAIETGEALETTAPKDRSEQT
ncbi:MAG: histone deacetylase [Candidatus Eisenbacteria bacterium]|nr:histone deacetylase [Candidatus Eisenbacteria bacterium]